MKKCIIIFIFLFIMLISINVYASTNTTICSNDIDGYSGDARISGTDTSYNYGGSITLAFQDHSGTYKQFAVFKQYLWHIIPQYSTINTVDFQFHNTEDGSGDSGWSINFNRHFGDFNEGTGTGQLQNGNCNYSSLNGTGEIEWTIDDHTWNTEYEGEHLGTWHINGGVAGTNVSIPFDENVSEIQDDFDDDGWIMWHGTPTETGVSNSYVLPDSSERTNYEWCLIINYDIGDNNGINLSIIEPTVNITNNATINFIINASDMDNDKIINCDYRSNLDGYIGNDTTITEGEYNPINIAWATEGNHIYNFTCYGEDKSVISALWDITTDITEPIQSWYIPNVNDSYWNENFYYHINISDTNLYSSNITLNDGISILYENTTIDYNTTAEELIDLIDISLYGNGTYDLCSEICDGHTNNNINLDYNFKDNKLSLKNTEIEFIGDIKDIKIIDLQDRLNYQIELNTLTDLLIKIPKKFQKVTNTQYKGHFINLEDKLWIDTNPFDMAYYYNDNDKKVIVIEPQSKILVFNSIGEINCNIECHNLTIDTDKPQIIHLQPLQNDNFSQSTSFDFTFQTTDTTSNIDNCTLGINGNNNVTDTTIIKNINQTITIDLNQTDIWSYNISCIDKANNINETSNITFYTYYIFSEQEETTTSGDLNESDFTTAQAINKVGNWIITFIIIFIWFLFIAISLIFRGDWFMFGTAIIGIIIFIFHDFNGISEIRAIFLLFNILIILWVIIPNENTK